MKKMCKENRSTCLYVPWKEMHICMRWEDGTGRMALQRREMDCKGFIAQLRNNGSTP